MGTIIKSVTINHSATKNGIVKLVSETASRCLSKAGLEIEDIGMLINTGVYSENHLIEPALATLVHKKLLRGKSNSTTFCKKRSQMLSFDLHNGGGGIINAIQVIDGFIRSEEIENGLIVCGDVKPQSGIVEHYNYSTGAAAVLLSNDKNKPGFARFKCQTFLEFKDDFRSTTSWEDGKLKFSHMQSSDYLENILHCALTVLHDFFEKENLAWHDIDLVCTSQSPGGFARGLQKKLNIKGKIVELQEADEIYSSGLLYSLHQAFDKDEFKSARNVLLLTAGAGITISLAYYKNEP